MILRTPPCAWLDVVIALLLAASCSCAPAYSAREGKYYGDTMVKRRSERLFFPPPSPIHFLRPFLMQSSPQFLGTPSVFSHIPNHLSASQVFKLPLRLLSNAKPFGIFAGATPGFAPRPTNAVMDYLPHAVASVANVFRLPLKFVSNAKPVGVYFKDPAFNFL